MLSLKFVIISLIFLISLCTILFFSVVYLKISHVRREKERLACIKKIKPILNRLLSAETENFFKNHTKGVLRLVKKLHSKSSIQTLEDLLLNNLEDSDGKKMERTLDIAHDLGFPEKSISMIQDRLTSNIAIGCRKAGLYHFKDAIPDLLKTLDTLSSNTQYQALMALARIGDADVMLEAFNKINRLVLVNERTISEILHTFSGDRYTLFKEMIHHESGYLARLSLKAIDGETANRLIKDIISIYSSGGKESRLACITAIGKSGIKGKITLLIKAMKDEEWEIRAMAAKTLGLYKSPQAIKHLAKAACDREWWVRQNAVTSILAYPDPGEILVPIVKSGDRYAYDSILYALDKANRVKLLSRIKRIRIHKVKQHDTIPAL